MAVFCSTLFNFSEIETIKNNNDTVGIVGINDSTPTVIFWKKKSEVGSENVNENSYTHFFQITRADGNDEDSNENDSNENDSSDEDSNDEDSNDADGGYTDDFENDSDSDVSDDAYNTLTITNDDNYLQVQDNSKCAIHALNNLLKGEYFTTVEMTNDETGIMNFPMVDEDKIEDVKQKIDLLKKKYYETNKKAGVNLFAVGTVLKQYAPDRFAMICDANPGDSYETAIIIIALNMFGYLTNEINHANIFKTLTDLRANDNFVGMILNTSKDENGTGGHYIAIRRVTDTNDFILVDSMKKVKQRSLAEAVRSDPIPLDSKEAMDNFISGWLAENTNYPYISNPVYKVTKNKEVAEQNFNELIVNASLTEGGRKSSTKKRRRRSASIAHSTNPVVHQRYTTKRRKSSTKKRGGRRKSSTRKRR
jgi:hypothetical protein